MSMNKIEQKVNEEELKLIGDRYWEIICRYESLLKEESSFLSEPSPFLLVKPHDQSASTNLETLSEIEKESQHCKRCGLEATRSAILFGEGDPSASLIVVAPYPTFEDDDSALLLQGTEGAYLEKWFASIGVNLRKDCYLTSLVKCMTPGGRIALPDEILACMPYLHRQTKTIKPKALVALGSFVFSSLTGRSEQQFDADVKAFGNGYSYQGIEVIPLYHPATVLADLSLRRTVWNVMNYLKEKI